MLRPEIATPLSHPIEPAFLDTTVCILRYFGTKEQRVQINSTLTQRKRITSSFVFMEYKRVTMRTCVEFHRLLTQVNDVSEALRHFSQSFSMSQLSFGYLMLSEILRSVGPDASQVLDYLENLIEELIKNMDKPQSIWYNSLKASP